MHASDLIEFFDAPAAASFNLTPDSAISFFRAKGLRPSFAWQDVLAEEHQASFTIAKMMDQDLLADVQESLAQALEQGTPFRAWANSITETLQARGWWGRQIVVDPLTGIPTTAQLGSLNRLKTIFRTNMQSSYAVGNWLQIQAQADQAPYLLYDAVDDARTRPAHRAWDGTILPADDPWWRTHYPPNGWNCRCSVIQLSDQDLADLGLQASASAPPSPTVEWTNPRTGKVESIPEGVDPTFNINAGEKRMQALQELALQKIAALVPELQAAALQGHEATKIAASQQQGPAIEAIQKELAQKVGEAELKRSIMKAAARSAQWQIDQAIANKTPYLSKAIANLKKTKAGQEMGPEEFLATAKIQAAKLHDTVHLSNWKAQYLKAGKLPAKGQQVFDALPQDAQDALLQALDAQKAAIAAEVAATKQLAAYASGDLGKLEAQLLSKLEADPGFAGLTALTKIEELQKAAASAKAKISQGLGIAGYKKAAIAGKPPTPAQKAAFDSLSAEDQAKLLQEIDQAKVAAAPPAPVAPDSQKVAQVISEPVAELNIDELVQIGPQKGSNPGGLYQDPATGAKWYVKTPASADQAINEVMAAQLYRLAGIEVPEVRLVQFKGQTSIASRIVDGLSSNADALTAKLPGVADGFAVDAWLANWDVVGLGYDNLLIREIQIPGKWPEGRAFRVDTGGALRYRAQGGLKGQAWGDTVNEIDSLRDPRLNPQAARVFGGLSTEQITDSVRKVLAITDQQLRNVVDAFPLDLAERRSLVDRLIARREDLARRYPAARPTPDAPPAPLRLDVVTKAEQEAIEASRINGYNIKTDGGDIEDHQVVISTFKRYQENARGRGADTTRLALKLREGAAEELARRFQIEGRAASGPPAIDTSALAEKGLQLFKGINYRAQKGEALGQTTRDRVEQFTQEYLKLKEQVANSRHLLADPALADAVLTDAREVVAMIGEYLGKVTTMDAIATPIGHFDFGRLSRRLTLNEPTIEAKALTWKRADGFEYHISTIIDGHMKEGAKTFRMLRVDHSLEMEIDGARIRFVPQNVQAASARGYLQIDVDGVGAEVSAKALATLERLGINSARATEEQRLALYVQRIGYLRSFRNSELRTKLKKIEGNTQLTEAQKIEEKIAALNADAGFDIRTSPNWDPQGKPQAFGHGRVTTDRPDVSQADAERLDRQLLLYHNPNGLGIGGDHVWNRIKPIFDVGGQFASLMDRARRGVKQTGSSAARDMETGGGSYVFTRLLMKDKVSRMTWRPAGVYWRGRKALRTDSITYPRDKFGEVDFSTQEQARGKTVDDMIQYTKREDNETIFRDTLSVFDDVERIVLNNSNDYRDAIEYLKGRGYDRWPDGRALEEVFDYDGSGREW